MRMIQTDVALFAPEALGLGLALSVHDVLGSCREYRMYRMRQLGVYPWGSRQFLSKQDNSCSDQNFPLFVSNKEGGNIRPLLIHLLDRNIDK